LAIVIVAIFITIVLLEAVCQAASPRRPVRRCALYLISPAYPLCGAEDSPVTDWHAQALERITILAELTMQNPDTSALEVQSRFFDLMSLFFTNTVAQEVSEKIAVPYRMTVPSNVCLLLFKTILTKKSPWTKSLKRGWYVEVNAVVFSKRLLGKVCLIIFCISGYGRVSVFLPMKP
jgi:hypothetical protein